MAPGWPSPAASSPDAPQLSLEAWGLSHQSTGRRGAKGRERRARVHTEQSRAVSRPQVPGLPDTPALARTRLVAVPAPARLCRTETDVFVIMKRHSGKEFRAREAMPWPEAEEVLSCTRQLAGLGGEAKPSQAGTGAGKTPEQSGLEPGAEGHSGSPGCCAQAQPGRAASLEGRAQLTVGSHWSPGTQMPPGPKGQLSQHPVAA